MDRKAAYQAGVVPLYFGGVMTEPEKQDYEKDTLCTADIFQEKDCKHFKPYESFVCRYPNICKFQGIGTVCNFEGDE